jgi:hypothetical protein
MNPLENTPVGQLRKNQESYHRAGPITDEEINEALRPINAQMDPNWEHHQAGLKSILDEDIERALEPFERAGNPNFEKEREREILEVAELDKKNDMMADELTAEIIRNITKSGHTITLDRCAEVFKNNYPQLSEQIKKHHDIKTNTVNDVRTISSIALIIYARALEQIRKTGLIKETMEEYPIPQTMPRDSGN